MAITPMMQQYLDMKEKYPGMILFFRLGDFYEMFFDDAKLVSQELELEMGQPFCSWESARRFFEIYSRDEDKSVITDDFLRSKLVETGREDFPLYLPQKRSVGYLKFSNKDL